MAPLRTLGTNRVDEESGRLLGALGKLRRPPLAKGYSGIRNIREELPAERLHRPQPEIWIPSSKPRRDELGRHLPVGQHALYHGDEIGDLLL